MSAYETSAKTVLLGREMGGDEGKNIQRDAVYVNEGVSPLADSRQRGRDILVKLGNAIEGEATEEVSASFLKTSREGTVIFRDVRRRICRVLQFFAQSEDKLGKRQALSGVGVRVHRGVGESWRETRVWSAISLGKVSRC